MAEPAVAFVGGRRCTDLLDLTDDLTALDGRGFWVAVVPFSGPPVCARFATVTAAPAGPPPSAAGAWRGPDAGAWRSSLDAAAHGAAVEDIRGLIGAGSVYQVNLCRILSATAPSGADVVALGARLAAHHRARHGATVSIPAAGVAVASASPELFLHRRGALVESRPIKGTAADDGAFLAKDRAENVMIVDLVRNDLGRVCEYGSIAVPALCAEERHPGLRHLVSTVTGRLRPGTGWAALLAAAFPPGSVTGAPKLAALAAIAALEPVARGPYCGAVGWVDADRREGALNVAIRTFWLAAGDLCFGTGGAITWDSDPAGEWAETELKAARLVALASGGAEVAGSGVGGSRRDAS